MRRGVAERISVQLSGKVLGGFLISIVTLASSVGSAESQGTVVHRLSVREVMVSAITPASNALWAAEDPQTFEAWKELEDAAVVMIAAGTLIKSGGAGENDRGWAADPAWQAYADTMIAAASDALDSARANDIDALLTATEVMYPPCEECHEQFHPDLL